MKYYTNEPTEEQLARRNVDNIILDIARLSDIHVNYKRFGHSYTTYIVFIEQKIGGSFNTLDEVRAYFAGFLKALQAHYDKRFGLKWTNWTTSTEL